LETVLQSAVSRTISLVKPAIENFAAVHVRSTYCGILSYSVLCSFGLGARACNDARLLSDDTGRMTSEVA
jgi:hypothetical protein